MPTQEVLHLFCDANLFLQCRPLEELDWSRWQRFGAVQLVVCGPVLREIDALKNKGNSRQANRARTANAMFRHMRQSGGTKLIHEAQPRVTLHIEPRHKRSEALTEELDYRERDDQLIGTAYEFAQSHSDVRLLTHDTTPLYIADGVGLPVELISDDWLLPPETDSRDKQIAALKDEIKQLTDSRPAFSVRFKDAMDNAANRYDAVLDRFTPLTASEIDLLMNRLRQRHPPAIDFGPRDQTMPDELAAKFIAPPGIEFFVPATDAEIAEYTEKDYPDWLNRCEQYLTSYHRLLQEQQTPPYFAFIVENQGTSPAKDCLVTMEARGDLLLMPPAAEYDDEQGPKPLAPDRLPSPPSPPRGHRRSSRRARAIIEPLWVEPGLGDIDLPLLRPSNRDPNELYYKPARPESPVVEFSLECQQWRHADGWRVLDGEIHVPGELNDASGAVVLRVQAENLPEPHEMLIPVRISVRHVSLLERAHDLVEKLRSS